MFGGSGACFHGDGTEWRGAALGEHYAVDAGSVGDAQKSAEILRIFDTIESEKQTLLRWIGER